jgi:hypothetical protein
MFYKTGGNMYYKCIVLVIASRGGAYDVFTDYWNRIISRCPSSIKIFLLYSDPNLDLDCSEIMVEDHVMTYRGEESLEPGILLKTMAAFRYCEKNYDYDFILRTNLSSFWNFPVFSTYLSDLPLEKYIGNIFMQVFDRNRYYVNYRWIHYFYLIDSLLPNSGGDLFYFLDGAGFLLSRDMIRLILIPAASIFEKVLDIPDDVAITFLLYHSLSVVIDGSIQIREIGIVRHMCDTILLVSDLPLDTGFIRNKVYDDFGDRRVDRLNFANEFDYFYLLEN